jgi:hypothetical protein
VGLLAPAGTFNMYINREPRFYVDIMFNGQVCPQSREIVDFASWAVPGIITNRVFTPENG